MCAEKPLKGTTGGRDGPGKGGKGREEGEREGWGTGDRGDRGREGCIGGEMRRYRRMRMGSRYRRREEEVQENEER